MKKLILFVIALLSLGVALPTLNAQVSTLCLTDISLGSACAISNHPVENVAEVHIDVCKIPSSIVNGSGFITGFRAPKLSFTREAMIIKDFKFVVSGYNPDVNNQRTWRLKIDFGDGDGWVVVPKTGFQRNVSYAAGTKPIIKYKGFIERIIPLGLDEIETDEVTKAFFINTATNPDYRRPDKIWKINAGSFVPPAYAAQSYSTGSAALKTSDAKGLAYIKLGEGHTQISKPIIFVDGIDFEATKLRYEDPFITLDNDYESKTVRCGVTGWDLFSMGGEDSWLDPILPACTLYKKT
jgi:hypothetical protein